MKVICNKWKRCNRECGAKTPHEDSCCEPCPFQESPKCVPFEDTEKEYPLKEAVKRIQEGLKSMYDNKPAVANAEFNCALDAIAAHEDIMCKLVKYLCWFMKDNDVRQGWDNPGKSDSPEIKEIRALLEEL